MKQKRHAFSTFLATALLAVAAVDTHAQSTAIGDFQVLMPSATADLPLGGYDVLINPFSPSSLFLATDSYSGSASIWRVTSSSPPDAPPFSSFDSQPLDSALSRVPRVTYNPHDNGLYAVGSGSAPATKGPKGSTIGIWKVRKSQNEGDTWSDDDQFRFSSKTSVYGSWATGITTDNAGNVFVSGVANDGRVNHWVMRRKLLGGGWETVYDAKAQSGYCWPYAMCFVPSRPNNPTPTYFAVGSLNDKWTVLRSESGALGSWSPVGAWPGDGSMAMATDVASDSQGNIYVSGVRGQEGNNQGWVVRRSSDGGAGWETLLDKAEGQSSWAWRLTIDAADNIWVAGSVPKPNGLPRWTVVRNSPGQPWQDSADEPDSWFLRTQPLEATTSKGRGMAFDPSGNLFLTGDVIEAGTHVGLLRLVPTP